MQRQTGQSTKSKMMLRSLALATQIAYANEINIRKINITLLSHLCFSFGPSNQTIFFH
jgi:hypothetical protein